MRPDPFALLCALVQVALRKRAAEPALARALDGVDWPRLVRLSGVHLLTPALMPALADPLLRDRVPEELRLYLEAMWAAATERNLALRTELQSVATCLNGIDIIPVVLKGGARLIDGLWPEPAFRFMHDLDLLVPHASITACTARLAGAGWSVIAGEEPQSHHVMLSHPEAAARIELHHSPLPPPWSELLPAARVLNRATPRRIEHAMVALPSLEDQLVHLVAHGMLQHQFLRNGRFLLRDLIELQLLATRAGIVATRSARTRFAAAGRTLAWDVAVELEAHCHGRPRTRSSLAARILAMRMRLQQRSPRTMLLLGPPGWLAAHLLAGDPDGHAEWTPWRLAGRLRMFCRKTSW